MSLAVAIWTGPVDYAIGADTRVTSHLASRHQSACKVSRRGAWLAAWTGDLAHAQAFQRAMGEAPAADDRDTVERWALKARASAMETTSIRPSDSSPYLDVDLLFVGPSGAFRLAAHGGILWAAGFPAVAVAGCADEYVLGWLDNAPRVGLDSIEPAILAAAARYPGVGGPVDILRPVT